ncbi:hypothetical protein DL93DRAFT_2155129 [Clavulina sp. PMI_390]|nr:hypothetical protein DL93DRAFT_2155129 [Clavulina sp. PMI_390]
MAASPTELNRLLDELRIIQQHLNQVDESHIDQDSKAWSLGAVRNKRYLFKKRSDLLRRVVETQEREERELDILEARLRNAELPIARLPDDVMVLVLLACTQARMSPAILAAVCHRWNSIVFSSIGSMLWTNISVDAQNTGEALSEALRLLLHARRAGSRGMSLVLNTVQIHESNAQQELQRAVNRLIPRCIDLTISLSPTFSPLLPLKESPSLRNLVLKELEYLPPSLSDGSLIPIITSSPHLRAVGLQTNSRPQSPDTLTQMLRSLSWAHALTHLDLDFYFTYEALYVLNSFVALRTLRWADWLSISDPPHVEHNTLLNLPHLETLMVEGTSAILVTLPMSAPQLAQLHIFHEHLPILELSRFPIRTLRWNIGSLNPPILDVGLITTLLKQPAMTELFLVGIPQHLKMVLDAIFSVLTSEDTTIDSDSEVTHPQWINFAFNDDFWSWCDDAEWVMNFDQEFINILRSVIQAFDLAPRWVRSRVLVGIDSQVAKEYPAVVSLINRSTYIQSRSPDLTRTFPTLVQSSR